MTLAGCHRTGVVSDHWVSGTKSDLRSVCACRNMINKHVQVLFKPKNKQENYTRNACHLENVDQHLGNQKVLVTIDFHCKYIFQNIFLKSYRFGTTWGRVKDERVFIIKWNIPIKKTLLNSPISAFVFNLILFTF